MTEQPFSKVTDAEARSLADGSALAQARRELGNWILAALRKCPEGGATLPELRSLLWVEIPEGVRRTSAVLWIGDQLSKSLGSHPNVIHDVDNKRWRIYDTGQLPLF